MRYSLCAILLVAVLLNLLSGCGTQPGNAAWNENPETVENLFATEPQPTSGQEPLPSLKKPDAGNSIGITNEVFQDSTGSYLVYEGGEMHLGLRLCLTDLPDKSFGIHLYVDGKPQPYYTADNETLQYMQTFPSGNGQAFTLDLIFTPITGKCGDVLEIGFAVVAYPDYFIDDDWAGITLMDWSGMGLTVRTKYLADPPQAQYPDGTDRMIRFSQEYVDLTASEAEMFSSGEYEKEVAYTLFANNRESYGNLFSLTDGDSLNVEFELKGSPVADFGLVLYLDHQPVSFSEENDLFVHTKNGQKVTVSASVDLAGFDGAGVFYAVLVPRNYRSDQLGGSCLLTILGPYYLSSARSLEALQGSE